jgi:hypothetical protein
MAEGENGCRAGGEAVTEIRNLRVLPHASFTVVRNTAARDQALTFRARGLLVWMLSHESGRLITAAAMIDAGLDGRGEVRAALRELEDANYIRRTRYRGAKGLWHHEMTVTDMPTMFVDQVDKHEESTRDEVEVELVDYLAEKIDNERKSGGFADHDRLGEHR